MNSGHETFSDAEVIVQDFSDGCETVSSAGRIRNNLHVRVVLISIDTHNKHGGVIFRWSRKDDFLSTAFEVSRCFSFVEEDTS